jgi:hypothetical protein
MTRLLLCAAAVASLTVSVPAQTVRFTPVGSIAVAGDMIRIDGGRAYVAAGNTLSILDISNPAAPKKSGAYELPDRIWGFSVAGPRAYMACDLHGLEILDVSNPSRVTQAGYYKTKGQAHAVDVFGKTALVSDHMLGVAYLDLSNEAKPRLVGSVFVEGYSRYVAIFGSLAYAVDSPAGFYVLDPSAEPLDPLGAIQTSDAGYGRIISIGVSDPSDTKGPKIAVVSGGRVLQVYDVSKPAAPVLLSTFATPGRGPRMMMKGRTAYVADNAEGIQVVDLSTPTKPRIVSSYKTAKPAIDVAVVDSLFFVVTGRRFNETTRRFEGDELLVLRQQNER